MYVQEVSIEINTDIGKDNIVGDFYVLMLHYVDSGQIQGESEPYINGNKVVFSLFTFEKDSLSERYNNLYINQQIKKIEELCNSTIQFKIAGESREGGEWTCACTTPEFYILRTEYVCISAPLICGTCEKGIPLYRLPHYDDHGYKPILKWEENYRSCDRLQMNFEVGERWALNQLQKADSQLSRQGREICRGIEELTNIPTYYYLYNDKKVKGDQLLNPCPACGKKWTLEKPLHGFYRFKCDDCRIVSSKSLNF